jgi:hypothetical protein
MIGLFGTAAGRSLASNNNSTTTVTSKVKSKSTTNTFLENQINDKLRESNNNNVIKKRPNFLKFFNDSFMKNGQDDGSSESSCKR